MSKIYFSKILHGCEKIIQMVQGYKSLYPIPNPQSPSSEATISPQLFTLPKIVGASTSVQVSLFLFLTQVPIIHTVLSHHTYLPFFLFTNGISVINNLLNFLKELLCSLVWLCFLTSHLPKNI